MLKSEMKAGLKRGDKIDIVVHGDWDRERNCYKARKGLAVFEKLDDNGNVVIREMIGTRTLKDCDFLGPCIQHRKLVQDMTSDEYRAAIEEGEVEDPMLLGDISRPVGRWSGYGGYW